MVEAVWSVFFVVSQNQDYGAGVVMLENGLVRGGDSSYYYVGDYVIKDDVITASVKVVHYAGYPNNVFGQLKEVNIVLSGKIGYNTFLVAGVADEAPGDILVRFNRIAEISR